jgi:uncharacterized delta-60 repeat protein
MTTLRRTLTVLTAALGGSLVLGSSAALAITPPAHAPGRVVFSVDGGAINNDVDGGAASAAAALPDGGAVLAGNGGSAPHAHAYAAEIRADGSLDSSFGTAGITTLPAFQVDQVLREPDGSFVVGGPGPSLGTSQFPHVMLAHLSADGTLDTSFGTNGILTLSIQSSCGDCAAASVEPGGDIVVTGNTGTLAVNPIANPTVSGNTQWVVARLTPTGALDSTFGQGGIVTLLPTASFGTAVATLANGDIVALGRLASGGQAVTTLTRLLPTGAPDPTFNGGNLVAVPGGAVSSMVANADGTVLVDTTTTVVRYTAAGLLDPSFGTGGVATITGFPSTTLPFPLPQGPLQTSILPAPGDSAVIVNLEDQGVVVAERLTPAGAIDQTFNGGGAKRIALGFGGGGSGFVVSVRPRPLPSLVQDSADIRGTVVERADGSFLAVNGVAVLQGTGEGEGKSIFDFAAAGLTAQFAPDASFGGPATPLEAELRVIRQRASTAHTRHGILVELTLTQPGLARVVIKAHGRVVAQNVLPAFGHGETTVPVELTAYGNTYLRSHRGVKVTATATGRDLLTNTATATASGTLR